jgi:hypothetical protein
MAKLFYAQKDALGFPIPGTMMSADTVPAVANVIAITIDGSLVFEKAHPQGLRYFVHLDRKGDILANSLVSAYDTPEGTVQELGLVAETTTTTTIAAGPICDIYFNMAGSPFATISYTDCNGVEVVNAEVPIISSVCVQPGSVTGEVAAFEVYPNTCNPSNSSE